MRTPLIAAGVATALTVSLAPMSVASAAPAAGEPTAPKTSGLTAVRTSAFGSGQRVTGTFDVANLDESVVKDYNQFITLQADGHFKASIPAARYFDDAKRAWAATNAVTKANMLIDKQRRELQLHGYNRQQVMGSQAVADGMTSKVLPMGEHATFQASWWGMTFTLDKVAADQLIMGLEKTQNVSKLLSLLAAIGVVIAPEASAIIGAVLGAIAVATKVVKSCRTDDGLVIKALWVPIPWCEKPKGPFQPAPKPTPTGTATPTPQPTDVPTSVPTDTPTGTPTDAPTQVPTDLPTGTPTDVPTGVPTPAPTDMPTSLPTKPLAPAAPSVMSGITDSVVRVG
ncbi:PT domain-containing protein [Arsenicicoccus dermatophilus]|uniref:PT domain-containing protein n=1 Tax=Arsenicicoccus dermatophilus TaxID=1076331 RepID=UPI001F4C6264|nr:PT domain-containing protein [Arsenicicoccus dermatophilus]MCH8612530.1 PT domain-containing protein [Arsenicicoccus dermatophilus]